MQISTLSGFQLVGADTDVMAPRSKQKRHLLKIAMLKQCSIDVGGEYDSDKCDEDDSDKSDEDEILGDDYKEYDSGIELRWDDSALVGTRAVYTGESVANVNKKKRKRLQGAQHAQDISKFFESPRVDDVDDTPVVQVKEDTWSNAVQLLNDVVKTKLWSRADAKMSLYDATRYMAVRFCVTT